jgi:hypothetical protein
MFLTNVLPERGKEASQKNGDVVSIIFGFDAAVLMIAL